MMDRRRFVLMSLGSGLGPRLAAWAQPAARMRRIGYLFFGQTPMASLRGTPFLTTLKELGWIEGQNVAIEYRLTTNPEMLDRLVAELVGLEVDVILADRVQAALAAKRGTNTVPVVFLTGSDPVAEGLVASLARPASNVTGQSTLISEASALTFSLMKQIMPRLSRLSYIWNPDNASSARIIKNMEQIAADNAVQFQSVPVRDAAVLDAAFEKMRAWRADAAWLSADGMLFAHRVRLGELAAKHRVPLFGGLREYADVGGVMSYAPDYNDAYRRAAGQVDKILKGVKPADIPVEQATRLSLAINLKAAKSLRLAIPPTVLQRADRVIE